MNIKFQCTSSDCNQKGNKLDLLEVCPECKSPLQPELSKLNNEIAIGIQELPVHLSQPLFELYKSTLYFKRLHLISDVLLGCFRLYGHAIIKIAESENLITDSIEQSVESLITKDSHGLWTSTICKILQEQDKINSPNLYPEFASLLELYYPYLLAIFSKQNQINQLKKF